MLKLYKRVQIALCGLMVTAFTLASTVTAFAKSKSIEQMPKPDTSEFIVEDEVDGV